MAVFDDYRREQVVLYSAQVEGVEEKTAAPPP